MLSCSVTCYVLQRNTASILNIGFNYVFVSAREIAEPFRTALICTYGQKAFIKGTWHAAAEKIQKWYAESKRLGTPDLKQNILNSYIVTSTFYVCMEHFFTSGFLPLPHIDDSVTMCKTHKSVKKQ